MTDKKTKGLKIYSSISEVAEMFGLNESTLRYWEKEFDSLRPATKNGIRRYAAKDIEVVRSINYLVKEQRMTLEGAREQLKRKTKNISRQSEVVHSLQKIKAELLSLKSAFDAIDGKAE